MGRLREPDAPDGSDDGLEGLGSADFFLNFGNRGAETMELDEAKAPDEPAVADETIAPDETVVPGKTSVCDDTTVPNETVVPGVDNGDFRDRCDS